MLTVEWTELKTQAQQWHRWAVRPLPLAALLLLIAPRLVLAWSASASPATRALLQLLSLPVGVLPYYALTWRAPGPISQAAFARAALVMVAASALSLLARGSNEPLGEFGWTALGVVTIPAHAYARMASIRWLMSRMRASWIAAVPTVWFALGVPGGLLAMVLHRSPYFTGIVIAANSALDCFVYAVVRPRDDTDLRA